LTLVVDASVALKWVLDEEGTDEALGLLGRTLVAPALLQAEAGNSLTKRVRGRELRAEQAVRAFDKLMTLVRLVPFSGLGSEAFQLSIALNHSIYDCYYLAAARKHGRLVTADAVFVAKVRVTEWAKLVYLLGEEIPDD
jgi:predicted nucleic acid-binding protein